MPQWAEAFSRWENGEVPVFNGDLTGWNGDSSGWDVSAVTDMSGMFAGVTDLSRRENDMSEQALDESIAHWARLRDAVENDDWEGVMSEGWHADQCALCSQVLHIQSGREWLPTTRILNGCRDCPVSEATGRKGCEGTPYRWASERLYSWGTPETPSKARERSRMTALDAVNEELEFLQRLRQRTLGRH